MIKKVCRSGLLLICLVLITSIAIAEDCSLLTVLCQLDGVKVGEVMVTGCASGMPPKCIPCDTKAPFAYCNGQYSDQCQNNCIACVVTEIDPVTKQVLMTQCYDKDGNPSSFY